jgi:hypothetical protein
LCRRHDQRSTRGSGVGPREREDRARRNRRADRYVLERRQHVGAVGRGRNRRRCRGLERDERCCYECPRSPHQHAPPVEQRRDRSRHEEGARIATERARPSTTMQH